MNIGILANEQSWYYRDLERAVLARGHFCQRLEFDRIVANVARDGAIRFSASENSDRALGRIRTDVGLLCAEPPPDRSGNDTRPLFESCRSLDAIIVRTMPPGTLEQVIYRMDVLGRLESSGVQVVNSPRSLECAVDKYLTTARLDSAGLPVPDTIVCEHEEDAMEAFEQLGGDVVVKPLFGSEGRGIVRVSDPDLAHRTFRTLMRLGSVLYLQRFIDHEGFDIRVLVLDKQVIGAICRRSSTDFRTNVSRNAIATCHSVTSNEIDLALKAADVTGARIAGVDLLYDRLGRGYVLEVNAVPGWQAFSRTTGIDVAQKLIASLE
ncbi:MAG: RimK family alpha-L-glutamate ligase [Planctomycetes bacterium]|nr:RimK family alpha-L-glutamate ligase [Planctomycetota bacterium]